VLDASAQIRSKVMTIVGVVLYLAIWFVLGRHMTGRVLYGKFSVGWFCIDCFVVLIGTILVTFCLDSKRKEPNHFIWTGMRFDLGVALILGSFILVLLAPYESTYLLTGETTIFDVLRISLGWGVMGMILLAIRKSPLKRGYLIVMLFSFYSVRAAYEYIDNLFWKIGCIAFPVAVFLFLCCFFIFPYLRQGQGQGLDVPSRQELDELAKLNSMLNSIIMASVGFILYGAIWIVGAQHMTGRVLYDKISIGWFCLNCFVVLIGTILIAFCLDLKRKEPSHFIWPGMRLGLGVALILGSYILVLLAPYESTYLITGEMTIRDVLWVSILWGVMGMISLAVRRSSSYCGYLIVMILCIYQVVVVVVAADEIIDNLYWRIGCIAFPVAVFLFLCCFIMFPVLKKIAEKRKTS